MHFLHVFISYSLVFLLVSKVLLLILVMFSFCSALHIIDEKLAHFGTKSKDLSREMVRRFKFALPKVLSA